MRTWASVGIDEGQLYNPAGENKIRCPRCRPKSKHPDRRCLNVNTLTGEWNCWDNGDGCGFSGSLSGPDRDFLDGPDGATVSPRMAESKEWRRIYKAEYLRRTEPLTPEALDWLHKRGISDTTITGCGLRWGAVVKDGDQWIKGVFFPYLALDEDGKIYIANIKKRCLCCKDHMQLMGADEQGRRCQLIFYGLPNMADTTIYVEGEMDALAYYEAGIKNVVSVPNGATLKSDTARLGYLESCRPQTDRVKHNIMSADDDTPGHLLKQEMARRLGFEKCSYVVYPEGCKDANDVLLQHGGDKLREMIEQAKPFPTKGLIRPLDMLEEFLEWKADDRPSGFSTGWSTLDEFYRPLPGQLTIVSGVPSHGKTAWVDALLVNVWRLHHWRSVVFSPENYPPAKMHLPKLAALLTGKTPKGYDRDKWARLGFPSELMSDEEARQATHYLEDGIVLISPEVNEEGHSLESLLALAQAEIYRFGAKVFVIDPFNEIEHHTPRGMAKTDYIGQCLMKLRRFARHNQICVFVVAHPTKMERKPEKIKDADGKEITIMVEPIPSAYDIEGSAHWYNKADNIIIVWRDQHAQLRDEDPHLNTIVIQKIKDKSTGRPGVIQLRWDPPTGRYLDPDEDNQPMATDELNEINQALGDDW